MNAEGLGRWARSDRAAGGAKSMSSSLPSAMGFVRPLEACQGFVVPFFIVIGSASEAARSNLSS